MDLIQAASQFADAHDIAVAIRGLPDGQAAEFDGASITVSLRQPPDWRAWYLVHSIGSIAVWDEDIPAAERLYEELREAKAARGGDRARLERVIARFRAFEERASEYSVWLLDQLGAPSAVPAFTVFFRADVESMTIFHRTGTAPVWAEFFARWKEDVAAGSRQAPPFAPRPIGKLTNARFPKQEVLQAV